MEYPLHRGTIIGLYKSKDGSGVGMLGIEDDVKGKVLIPCDGNETCRAFDKVFGGVLRGGQFHNDAIQGERIFYILHPTTGALKSFLPIDLASPEEIAEYEAQSLPPEHGTVKVTAAGFLPPDHPIYSRGPMIFGRPDPKKPTEFN